MTVWVLDWSCDQSVWSSLVFSFLVGVDLVLAGDDETSTEWRYCFNLEWRSFILAWRLWDIGHVGSVSFTKDDLSKLCADYESSVLHPAVAGVLGRYFDVFVLIVDLSVVSLELAFLDPVILVGVHSCNDH